MPTRSTEKRLVTLRRRLLLWGALAFAAVIATLTVGTLAEERRLVRDLQAAAGVSLLAHLVEMPEMNGDAAAAERQVAALSTALAAAGVSLELAPASGGNGDGAPAVASRRLELSGRSFDLRYLADPAFVARLSARSAMIHVLHGLAAIAVALFALDWILRAKLARPLHRIAHQIRFMRSGGGWEPRLPAADAEISEVSEALRDLGPALHDQVRSWIEAERRSGVAQALSRIRSRIREPRLRALAQLGDLLVRDAVPPGAKPRLRAVVADVERMSREIDEEERDLLKGPATAGGEG